MIWVAIAQLFDSRHGNESQDSSSIPAQKNKDYAASPLIRCFFAPVLAAIARYGNKVSSI